MTDTKYGVSPLPSVEEILGGQVQAGVAAPAGFAPAENDGTVERVGRAKELADGVATGGAIGDDLGAVAAAAARAKAARAKHDASVKAFDDAKAAMHAARKEAEAADAAFVKASQQAYGL